MDQEIMYITEEYNGTSWVTVANNAVTRGYQISQNRGSNSASGTGLVFGGSNHPSPGNRNNTEEFDPGTSTLNLRTVSTSS